jgi:putative PEP-CTERM system TPR-repeat lipoprotein
MFRRVARSRSSLAALCGIALLSTGMAGCNRTDSVESLVVEAKSYQKKGDNKAALIQAKNAVSQSPDDPALRMLLAEIHLDEADPVSAEKEWRKALSLGARPDAVMLGLARSLHAQGQYKKMLELTEESVGKNDPDVVLLRADAHLALGSTVEAKEGYDAVLKARPDGIDAQSGMARYLFAQKDIDGALRVVDGTIAKHPDGIEPLILKGKLLQALGQYDNALLQYEQALKRAPQHPTAQLEKAFLQIAAKRYDAARKTIADAKAGNPANLLTLYMQGLLDYSEGKQSEARLGLQKLLAAVPDHMPSVLLLATVEMHQGAFEQSERNARKFLETYPDHEFARNLLIVTQLKSGLLVEATSNVQIALRVQAPSARLYGLAGQVYLMAGNYAKASEMFERATGLDPKLAEVKSGLGISRLAQGQLERGLHDIEQATMIDADSNRAALTLVAAQLRLRQYDKALVTIAGLDKISPNDANLSNLRGAAQASKGELALAHAAFDRALQLQPNYLGAAANKAQIHIKAKQSEQAKAVYLAFLAKNKGNAAAMGALATIAEQEGKPDEAISWLQKALSDNPNSVDAAVRLGIAQMNMGKLTEALTMLRKYQVNHPSDTQLLDLLGNLQIKTSDKAGAVETYSRLAALLPKSAEAQFRLAEAYARAMNEPAALAGLKRALALKPDLKEAQVALGEMVASKGDFAQAITLALQLQKQAPTDPAGYALEGRVRTVQRKPELALKPFEKALSLKPSASNLIKVHGALMQSGNEKDADARLAQWMAQHPEDTLAQIYAAEYDLARGRIAAAVARLEVIVKSASKDPVVLNNLAYGYSLSKDPRARATAEKALALAPNNPSVLDTLGVILIGEGDNARGVAMLRTASAIVPGDLDLRMRLANGLIKTNDKLGARKELELIVSKAKKPSMLQEARAQLQALM